MAAQGAIAVVIITCKRPEYLRRSMDSFLRASRDPDRFPIVISQDGDDGAMTARVEKDYAAKGVALHIHHPHDPDAGRIAAELAAKIKGNQKQVMGYVRIAQHYGFAMRKMFDEFGFGNVIFLEEDMEVAPDFFSYFSAMLPHLQADPKLFCVSAWNDNGYETLARDTKAAFRTDFFPGLGWMMPSRLWGEVRDRWPNGYWDEFVRRPDVRKGRHCIRPEVSRSYTFGEEGTSAGQFYKSHLSRIRLNTELVDWSALDLSSLASEGAFDAELVRQLHEAVPVQLHQVDSYRGAGKTLKLEYDDKREYAHVAKKFSLMTDEKEGIRRMSYRGVIPFFWEGNRMLAYTRQWPTEEIKKTLGNLREREKS